MNIVLVFAALEPYNVCIALRDLTTFYIPIAPVAANSRPRQNSLNKSQNVHRIEKPGDIRRLATKKEHQNKYGQTNICLGGEKRKFHLA